MLAFTWMSSYNLTCNIPPKAGCDCSEFLSWLWGTIWLCTFAYAWCTLRTELSLLLERQLLLPCYRQAWFEIMRVRGAFKSRLWYGNEYFLSNTIILWCIPKTLGMPKLAFRIPIKYTNITVLSCFVYQAWEEFFQAIWHMKCKASRLIVSSKPSLGG